VIPLTIQLFIYLEFEDRYLPACDTVHSDGMLPKFWKNLLLPSSSPEDGDMQVPLKRFQYL
jgi:hypothetical protein